MLTTLMCLGAEMALPPLLGVPFDDPVLEIRGVTADGAALAPEHVWLLDRAQVHPGNARDGLHTLSRRLGRPVSVPEEGPARCPSPESTSWVVIEAKEHRGRGLADRAQRQLEVLLRPIQSIEVRVLDPEGKPAPGVPLFLHRGFPITDDPVIQQTVSKEGGIARFTGVELLGPPEPGEAFWIRFGFPIAQRTAVSIPATPGTHEVDLTLPPTASLLVKIEGFEDFEDGPEHWSDLAQVDLSGSFGDARQFVKYGRAFFPRVGVGTPLQIHLSGQTVRMGGIDQEAEPFVRSGESRVVRLQARPNIKVVAKLVDRRGIPLSGRLVQVAPIDRTDGEPTLRGSVCDFTDAEGQLSLRGVDLERWQRREGPVETSLLFRIEADPEQGFTHSLVRLDSELASATVLDLGTIVEGTGPILARGRVVDGEGSPVAEVDITAAWSDLPPFFDQVLRARTDLTGRFEFLGPRELVPTKLWLESRGWVMRSEIPVQEFGETIEIAADRAGTLSFPAPWRDLPRHGRVALDWRLSGEEGQHRPRANLPGLSFLLREHIPRIHYHHVELPGRYTLTFLWRGVELDRIEGIEIAPGLPQDPRVEQWDATTRTRVVRVRVVNAAGETPEYLEVGVRSPGAEEFTPVGPLPGWSTTTREYAFVLPLAGPVEIEADCPDHPTTVFEVDSTCTLTLPEFQPRE